MSKIDTTKYNAQVANAASQVRISSTVFKAFIADLKLVIDANDDLRLALESASTGTDRNALINPNFSFNQRAVSGTVVLAAGAYGHDRWKAGASGCTYTFATALNVTTITITAGSLLQTIEGTSLFSGTYTLSWTGTAQGKIGAGSYSATGITGTAVGGTNLTIEFNTGTLSKVQLNAGATALPFQLRSLTQEEKDCERFFQLMGTSGLGGYKVTAISTNDIYFTIPIPTLLRTTPSLPLNTETTHWNVRLDSSTASTGFVLSVQAYSKHMLILKATKAAHGLTYINNPYLSANSALFGFDAEI